MDRYIRVERKTTKTGTPKRRRWFAALVLGVLAATVGLLVWWSLLRPQGPQSPAMDSSTAGFPTHSMALETTLVPDLAAPAETHSVFGRDLDQGFV